MSECIGCNLPVSSGEFTGWHDGCAERAGLVLTEVIARRQIPTPQHVIGGSTHAGASRVGLLARWGYRCWFCHVQLDARTMTKEHLLPKSRGGSDSPTNLRPACRRCNSAKGDMTEEEFVDLCQKILRVYAKRGASL